MQKPLFHQETIKYNLGLLWAMLLTTIAGTLAAAGFSFSAGSVGWFAPLFMTFLIATLAIYFATTELRVELREDSLFIQYHPWRRYEYFREDIESITLEEYHPGQYQDFNWLRDRMRITGNQYNLHVKLKDGRSFYVSTGKAGEVRRALAQWSVQGDFMDDENLELDRLLADEILLKQSYLKPRETL